MQAHLWYLFVFIVVTFYSNYKNYQKKIFFVYYLLLYITRVSIFIVRMVAVITIDGKLAKETRLLSLYVGLAMKTSIIFICYNIKPFRFLAFLYAISVTQAFGRVFITRATGFNYPGLWHIVWQFDTICNNSIFPWFLLIFCFVTETKKK